MTTCRRPLMTTVLFAGLSAGGCLSLFPGTTSNEITFESQPSGALVEVLADGKLVASARTPGRITLRVADGYVVRISKSGYRAQTFMMRASFRWYKPCMSTIIGLPTLGGAMLYDGASGAWRPMEPDHFRVKLKLR